MLYDNVITSMVEEMKSRTSAEAKVLIEDSEEVERLRAECEFAGAPYYSDLGQFCGGFSTERFVHPTDSSKRVQFSDIPEEHADGHSTECVIWTPYKNYPYPL